MFATNMFENSLPQTLHRRIISEKIWPSPWR